MTRRRREADYIVVGAGAAGAVMAARLSDDRDVDVLLVEAGGPARGPLFSVPLMTGLLLRGGIANWGYMTEPVPTLDNRRLKWPRGKALGGSTAINGMVWRRGLPLDFDQWAQRGLSGWSWRDVEPWFRKAEGGADDTGAALGRDGPMHLSRGKLANPLFDAWFEATRALGLPENADYNSADSGEGTGRYDFAIRKGQRVSTARGYLDAARSRPNLDIVTHTQALRVVIERGRATGLLVTSPDGDATLHARREVIICGGSINSPHLLMHSGIGPADHLRHHGITVAADVPGVGQGLQDHLLVRVEYQSKEPVTIDSLRRVDRAALAFMRAVVFGTGPAATFPIEAGALLKSEPWLEAPDLQTSIMPGLSAASLRVPGFGSLLAPDRGPGFFSNIYQMRPNSRGHLGLASSDPLSPPRIAPNYLSAAPDRDVLRRGVKLLREIYAQSAFDRYRGAELSPGPEARSDEDLDRWISATADTVFHPTSTCRMGTASDRLAVVDAGCRVRGIDGLRVVDASAMPAVTSGNTMAPTIMIAERVAHMMRSGATTPEQNLAHV
ncbi:MAG: GMC family oxidoreductase N-terminal domain-containing protein [Gammaproteobacteria bacterium]|nr:GMC family oxidoreductase N-terminal domain-containing protein [Gammaproteobacteria bacterium]